MGHSIFSIGSTPHILCPWEGDAPAEPSGTLRYGSTGVSPSRQKIVDRFGWETRFRQALFTEAINAYLAVDTKVGKAILRDLVNATVGFEALAAAVDIPSKSLRRMLAPHGNPSTENFFGIIRAPRKQTRVNLSVTARAA